MQSISHTPWFDLSNLTTNQTDNKHAVIIGGGIAGSQMAWHLCQLGWKVTLIERHDSLAQEASGNQAGIISPKITAKPSEGEDFYVDAFEYTLNQIKILQNQGCSVDWNPCGMLQLAHNEREQKRWQAIQQRVENGDFKTGFVTTVDEQQADTIAGIKTHHKAFWFQQAGWIKPRSFCASLTQHPNCHIIRSTQAISLQHNDDAVWQVLDQVKNSIAQASHLIIANGKDLQSFKQSQFLAGVPILGQTTSALASDYSKKLNTVIGHKGYLVPAFRNDNDHYQEQHLFGATFEKEFSKISLKPEANQTNLTQLHQFLPKLANSLEQINSAHCAIRFTTPDRLPYAGGIPKLDFYTQHYADLHQGKYWKKYPSAEYQKGLYILGGFGSRGLTTSGLCAHLLAKQIDQANTLSTQEQKLLHSLHPARFIIKNLKKNRTHDN